MEYMDIWKNSNGVLEKNFTTSKKVKLKELTKWGNFKEGLSLQGNTWKVLVQNELKFTFQGQDLF